MSRVINFTAHESLNMAAQQSAAHIIITHMADGFTRDTHNLLPRRPLAHITVQRIMHDLFISLHQWQWSAAHMAATAQTVEFHDSVFKT